MMLVQLPACAAGLSSLAARRSLTFASRPALAYALSARRTLATTTQGRSQIESKRIDEVSSKGTEGPHYADTIRQPAVSSQNDAEVTGDWVLFHPVYSSNELKAIEVNPQIYVIL